MEPVLVEVSCKLDKDHPKWNEIESMYIEIGYPGKSGNTLWKHIGWLKDKLSPFSRNFAHALWDKDHYAHTLTFDFYPAPKPQEPGILDKFYIKKHITEKNGNTRVSKSMLVRGDFSDDIIALNTIIPA